MRLNVQDSEIAAYSRVMEAPAETADGFTFRTALCAFGLGLFMMPGILYLNLVVGASLGPAGPWVAVILFMEVMRRARQVVRQQELFILLTMAGLMMSSPFSGLLWNQYLVQSPFLQAMGISDKIPRWVAPPASSESYALRTFFHRDWLLPIGLISLSLVLANVDQFGLGLALYYLTAKVERLPFPMAPVNAMGTVALAESPETKGGWKWPAFSTGAALGIVWGGLYLGVPILSELITGVSFQLFPIPWWETSPITERFLQAVPTGIAFDLTLFMLGLVIPFWAAVGGFLGVLFAVAANPFLFRAGILKTWMPGMDTVQTQFANSVDFYFSFGLGISFSVALIGIYQAVGALVQSRLQSRSGGAQSDGDSLMQRFRTYRKGIWLGGCIYLASSLCYGVLIRTLVPEFPVGFLVIYALVYVPILSYISARLIGITGRGITIPFVNEATLLLSGIRGIAVWFAPLGGMTQTHEGGAGTFRVMELTGTRFRSMVWARVTALPVILVFSLVASQMIWRMGEVPSEAYPFARKMWQLNAQNSAILWSSTLGGESLFRNAWNPTYLAAGLGSGLALAILLSGFQIPVNLFYGLIAGLGSALPHSALPVLAGALVARFVLWRRFGRDRWLRLAPVVVAGFTCGLGLSGMFCFGLVLIQKTIMALPW